MHHLIAPPVSIPRHYLQVSNDFQKLLGKIEHVSKQCTVSPMTAVEPLPLFRSWDSFFLQHQRYLPQVFDTLTARILSRSGEITLADTVCHLVPLEQHVYKLLQLRETIGRYRFSGGWQEGQDLLLARVDKTINDIKKILTFFVTAVQGVSVRQKARLFTWSACFECHTETQDYANWFTRQTGSISALHYPRQYCHVLLHKMVSHYRSIKRDYRLPVIPFLAAR